MTGNFYVNDDARSVPPQASGLTWKIAPPICINSANSLDACIAPLTEPLQILELVQNIGQVELCAQANRVRMLKLSPVVPAFSSFRVTAAICGTEIALYGCMKRNIVEHDPTIGCPRLTGDTDDAVN